MKIINIVDNATPVNTGIWNAAVSTAEALKNNYDIDSELWYPKMADDLHLSYCVTVPLQSINLKYIEDLIIERALSSEDTIIITHGCWQYPTKWGMNFKSRGYKWIYVPHGMLEPWSLRQKKWLKSVYFKFREKPKAKYADYVRAVGSPELKNLTKYFDQVKLIPNGVKMPILEVIIKKDENIIVFIFMARLHYKKGVESLVKAWVLSNANLNSRYKLIIAGPDHGELEKILPYINSSSNIEYIGMVKGTQKHDLLINGHFYILPSFSEGFPTSVVEALSYGMVPLITSGCNFPEAIENKVAIEISTDETDILEKINLLIQDINGIAKDKAVENYEYILRNYSIDHIAKMQYKMFNVLLPSST